MATANSTRRSADSSLSAQSKEFPGLLRRLLVAVNQLTLVSQHFGDLTSLSNDDAPAGLTLQAAVEDLDQLYNEFDLWEVSHEHRPKSEGQQPGPGIFTSDVAERTPIAEPLPPVRASDETAHRIRAFLASMRPLRGFGMGDNDQYQRGRVLIERMAMSARGTDDPSIVLSPAHCAAVLSFLSSVEPLEPQTWWNGAVVETVWRALEAVDLVETADMSKVLCTHAANPICDCVNRLRDAVQNARLRGNQIVVLKDGEAVS